jgi:DNA-binding transcriptional MerR regulator
VIRYWEKEIPLIQSRRDMGGRRVYTKQDLLVLFRLKYLLYERRFTIRGAREQLFREYTGDHVSQDLKAGIEALRSDLLDMYFLVRRAP